MASTLREIAPDVEIYALGTSSSDESDKVDAMIQAINWAIANDLDVLTYSGPRFSPENRVRLDSCVDRALAKGIVTTFIHYPHPGNILPGWLGPRTGDPTRMSWRAGMQGNEPVTWLVNCDARRANRSRFGVANSVPPYAPSMCRFSESRSTTTTFRG